MNNNLNKSNLTFFFTFLTNFKPNNFNILSNMKTFKYKKNNKIICRNFFLFILLLKYFNKNLITKSSLWVKPLKQKNLTLLRAPYRYKLSRQQITLVRYFIFYKISFIQNNFLFFKSLKHFKDFILFLKRFNIWIESNLVYQFKIKCIFTFFFKSFFLL